MSERPVLALSIPDDAWMEDRGGDRLLAILVLNGTFHHLEAIRVVEDDDGIQQVASEDLAETFEAMYTIGGEGPFDTTTVRGAEYVLVVTPFQ
jgi:hypothetical protein